MFILMIIFIHLLSLAIDNPIEFWLALISVILAGASLGGLIVGTVQFMLETSDE